MNLLLHLEQRNKLLWILVGYALIGGVGILNYLTGSEFAFSFFYLIPISLITWFTGRWFGLSASIVSALVWLIDAITVQEYPQLFTYIWNALLVLGFFVVVTFLLSALKQALEHERELAQKDYLTGAINTRFFFHLLDMEINRSQRYKHPFTVACIDIDNFKTVNDRFGHTAGNQVLCELVDQSRKHLRNTDVIARIGGDEFALLLPETDQGYASIILQRIHDDISAQMQQNGWPVTISVGVITCVEPPLKPSDIFRMADELMYSVKHDNKNGTKYSTYGG